jgi:hypothetical protein
MQQEKADIKRLLSKPVRCAALHYRDPAASAETDGLRPTSLFKGYTSLNDFSIGPTSIRLVYESGIGLRPILPC